MTSSQLLAQGAIERLPILVPKYYALPGINCVLFDEKMSIMSPNILKFYRAEKFIFDVDRRKAGAVAKALQSKPAPTVITKNDARFNLKGWTQFY